MIFKTYNSDFGFKNDGTAYDFTNVKSLQIEDNEKNRLIRGANGKDTLGLAYKEGVKDPKKWTIQIMGMSMEIKEMLDDVFAKQKRVDVYAIDRTDGSSKMAKQAVLCNKPQQLSLDESPDSMDVQIEFETFDSSEVHKS